MTDASLLYLQLIPVEQKGWLTLRFQNDQQMTAAASIGHISPNSIVVLSSWQTVIPTEHILQAEFRYIDNSGIYTLVADHLQATLSPTGGLCLTLQPPFQMTHKQQRNFIRIEPDEQVPIVFSPLYPDDYPAGQGIIKDISGSGLRFMTQEFIHKDSILTFSFQLPDSDEKIHAVGQVVRKAFVDDLSIPSVRFLEIDTSQQQQIIAYCVAEQLRIAQNQQKQKRKFARISLQASLPVQIRSIDDPTMHDATIVNIGGGGMLVQYVKSLPNTPLYELTFALPHTSTLLAYAKVVEKTITPDWSRYHFEFVEIHPKAQGLIVDYVLNQQLSLIHESATVIGSPL
ncbi:PilZ domain-containing protein [Brevibacillus ginsengisoli]|uniref:PilZ domain-containing protein n=1 Tax=Brevibacillus ginsengisoli TaxID=363854 RepID=UPI003CE8DB4F